MYLAAKHSNHRLVVSSWKLVASLQEAADHLKSLGAGDGTFGRVYLCNLGDKPKLVKFAEWGPLL